MGSPDSFRSEPPRGGAGIDDLFVDGIVFSRWDASPQGKGREHVATYATGLSYNSRGFSFYQNGNCVCVSMMTHAQKSTNMRTHSTTQ